MENCIRHMKSGAPNRLFGSKFVDLLNKISINSTDVNGQTLLHHAVKLKKIDYVDLLLSQGVNVNVSDHYGDTPLRLAIKEHFVEGVQALIKSTVPNFMKERESLETKFKSERRKRTYAESQVEVMRRDLDFKDSVIRDKQFTINRLEDNLVKAKSHNLVSNKSQILGFCEENKRLKSRVNILEIEVDQEKLKRSKFESKYNLIHNEVESLRAKVPKLEKELTKVTDERDTFKKRYEKLREGMKK